jgi:hypothetical protein
MFAVQPRALKPVAHSVEIDWSHPMTRGLAFAALFGDGANPLDFVKGARGAPTNGPGQVAFAVPGMGAGASFNNYGSGANCYFSFVNPSDAAFTGAISIIWRGLISIAGQHHFVGKHASNGGSQNPFDFRTDFSTKPTLVRAGTPPHDTYSDARTVAQDTVVTLGVSSTGANGANATLFYIDGVAGSGATGSNAPYTGSGADIRVGRRDDGSVQLTGAAFHVFIWSRVLSTSEHRSLHYEPYQIFKARRSHVGIRTFNPVWAVNSNPVIAA